MAKSTKLTNAVRSAACDAIVDLIDAGAGAGTLKFYTGAAPTNASDAPSGTLLGTLTFSDPAFGAASNGVATASAVTSDTSADNSGTAGYFRVLDPGGTVIFQGTCGTSDANAVFTPTDVIVAGGTIACSSFTFTVPAESTS